MKIDCYFPHDVNTLNYQGVTMLLPDGLGQDSVG